MENNKDIIPVFYDHSSKKSSLTWWGESDWKSGGPTSILKLAKENSLKDIFFVSKNFHNYDEADRACSKNGLNLRFGLELIITDNIEKNEQSKQNESKVIVWMKNSLAWKDIILLSTEINANPDNKYYYMRGSWKMLCELWTDNLALSLPFFDSVVHKNLLNYGSSIVPEFPVSPILHREIDTGLPFEDLINSALDSFNENGKYEEIKTKTIFYEDESKFRSYMILRSIWNKKTFDSPDLSFCCSSNFSFQKYLEISK